MALLLCGPARAEPEPDATDAAATERLARLHFEAGKQAFELGHFADAVVEFQRGYDLSHRPLFLLNLAYAMFRLERYDETVTLCRRFLAASPSSSSEEEAKQLLWKAEMHQRLHESAAPPPIAVHPAPPSAPAATPARDSHAVAGAHKGPARPALAWSGIVVLAVGVGAIAGAAALTASANQLNNDFNHPAPGTVYDRRTVDRWTAEQNASIGLYVVGGAALIGGIALTVVGWRHGGADGSRRWSIAPALGPATVGTTAVIRF